MEEEKEDTLEDLPEVKKGFWDRFDWLWNSLMASALALAASFMIQIFHAFSVGGLSWGETFATIVQGAGIAVVGSGALTTNGKKRVDHVLNSLGIAPKYQAEVTFLASLVILGAAFLMHKNMPEYFYEEGNKYYQESNLPAAEIRYLQAMKIDPEDVRFNLALGRVYESMGDLNRALPEYKKDAESGDPEGLNNIGRVHLFRFDPIQLKRKPKLAESFLRMGLQRSEIQDTHPNIKYQLNRNLGWALLDQKKYDEAEVYLQKAIDLDQGIKEDQIGGGVGYCLMGHLYQSVGKLDEAQEYWETCRDRARPETIFEYKWFMEVGQETLADYISTTKIVAGLDEAAFDAFVKKKVKEGKQVLNLPKIPAKAQAANTQQVSPATL